MNQATRHHGIGASRRAAASSPRAHPACTRPAFTLIEVLLAIFILGIGVISIAALFPAGIAQQRLSNDEIMGPIVVNNAIEIIRSKVKPDDFGTFEEFGIATFDTPRPTISGDWSWLRPAFVFDDDGTWPPGSSGMPPIDENGAIDLFSFYFFPANSGLVPASLRSSEFPVSYPMSIPGLFGIPFNTAKYDDPTTAVFDPSPPRILITQAERYYPQASKQYLTAANSEPYKPQYVWDCMFRRFQGRIQVAIFVYRVTIPGGGTVSDYKVARNNEFPPLPIWLNFVDANFNATNLQVCADGPWDTDGPDDIAGNLDDSIIRGVQNGTQFNPDNDMHAWQQPRQWIIDQNNNLYRVIGLSREDADNNIGDVEVELVRPVAPVLGRRDSTNDLSVPSGNCFFYVPQQFTQPTGGWYADWINENIVSDIWYIPLRAGYDVDGNGSIDGEWTLTPVFAAVKEL